MTMASRCGASCATWQISVLNVGFKDSRRTSSYYFSRSIQRNLCPPRLPVPASLHCGRLHAGIPLSFPSLLSTTRRYIDRWPVVVSSSGHQAAAAAARAAAVAAERAPSLYSTPLHPASYRLQLLRSKERQTAGVSIFCLSSRSLHSVAGDAQAEAAPTTSVAASAGVQSEGDMPLHANPSTETAVLKTEPAEGSYAQELFQHIQNAVSSVGPPYLCLSALEKFMYGLQRIKTRAYCMHAYVRRRSHRKRIKNALNVRREERGFYALLSLLFCYRQTEQRPLQRLLLLLVGL